MQVQINTEHAGASPQEAEQQVTIPSSCASAGCRASECAQSPEVPACRKSSATFDDQTSIYRARQLISERFAGVELPAGIERPN